MQVILILISIYFSAKNFFMGKEKTKDCYKQGNKKFRVRGLQNFKLNKY